MNESLVLAAMDSLYYISLLYNLISSIVILRRNIDLPSPALVCLISIPNDCSTTLREIQAS